MDIILTEVPTDVLIAEIAKRGGSVVFYATDVTPVAIAAQGSRYPEGSGRPTQQS